MTSKILRRALLPCLLALSAPAIASAGGASTIAKAPLAKHHKKYSGNTADGEVRHCTSRLFWKLKVKAGDKVTINLSSAVARTRLSVFKVGTNDFNVSDSDFGNSRRVIYRSASSNLHNQIKFRATKTGKMPLEVSDPDDCEQDHAGPFSFTAYVKHYKG